MNKEEPSVQRERHVWTVIGINHPPVEDTKTERHKTTTNNTCLFNLTCVSFAFLCSHVVALINLHVFLPILLLFFVFCILFQSLCVSLCCLKKCYFISIAAAGMLNFYGPGNQLRPLFPLQNKEIFPLGFGYCRYTFFHVILT